MSNFLSIRHGKRNDVPAPLDISCNFSHIMMHDRLVPTSRHISASTCIMDVDTASFFMLFAFRLNLIRYKIKGDTSMDSTEGILHVSTLELESKGAVINRIDSFYTKNYFHVLMCTKIYGREMGGKPAD